MKRNQLSKAIKQGNQIRVRIYPDELEHLNNIRSLWNEALELGQDPRDVKHGWIKNKETSLFVNNPDYKGKESQKNEFIENLIKSLKEHSPKYTKIKRKKSSDGHLLVIDPADIHVGKLCSAMETGEAYNSEIAVQRVKEGVQGILDKSSGFNIDSILFIGGNDILHIDTPQRKTTSGKAQCC